VAANSTSIGRLEKYELSFTLSGTSFSNAFDPAQIDVSATFTDPLGGTHVVHGFYMREYTKTCGPTASLTAGAYRWKVRYSPAMTGNWSVSLSAVDSGTGTGTAGPYNFTCTTSSKKGLIRVSPLDNRYFQYDDGSQFIPIGQNLAWSTTGNYYTCDFDNWQPDIANNGGNMMRWWFATFNTAVEWDESGTPHSVLGNYSTMLDQHWRADEILDQSRARGLVTMITLMNMGDLRASGFESKWGYNVYNSAKGGPCSTPQQFFTNASAKDYFKRRLRYTVARWGYLPNIMWETFNEMDFTNGYNSTAITAWHQEMVPYLKAQDLNRHMVSVSFSDPGVEDANVFSLPEIDFTGYHRYSGSASMEDEHVAFTQAERAVLQQVEQAYVEVLGAEARLQIRRAASVAERRHLDEARRLVVAGSKTSIDVAQADARVASARVAEVRADNARAQAIAALAQAIAGDLPADATFTTPWPAPLVDEDAALEGLVAEAVRADPELARLNAERVASAQAREATRLATRPTLAATASAGVDALGTYGVPPDDRRVAGAWSAGVTLSWQLYDGGARRARLRAADATLRAADAELADRLLGLRAQLSAARLDIAAAKAQQGAAAASVAAAREQLRQAEARSAAGLGTSAELTDAQDALTQALGDAADADYQLAAARTILRYRLGRLVTHPGHRESNP